MPTPRKKSPRAPSLALDEAIDRVGKVYEKERRHAAPVEVVAQDMGYKNANNGAALSVLASLRYYGLLERPKDGQLAVSKEFETYTFAPDARMRHSILQQWLRNPPVFADLLEKFSNGLPSDANLRFELIQQGFSPPAAEALIPIFKRSADFAQFFSSEESASSLVIQPDSPLNDERGSETTAMEASSSRAVNPSSTASSSPVGLASPPELVDAPNADKIPVRLSKGRRAWLVIPQPFFEADKVRLKAQIDLLLTEDQDKEDY